MERSSTIIVSMHKPLPHPTGSPYCAIFAGRALSPDQEVVGDIVGDNTGDNISSKNREYCELTALYWLWRNCDLTHYVGLCHYRRYFDLRGGRPTIDAEEIDYISSFTSAEYAASMAGYDIILAEPFVWKRSIRQHYYASHHKEDLDTLEQIIAEEYPDYREACDELLSGNRLSVGNMFVTNSKIANDYCEWLFALLLKVESRVDLTGRNAYDRRLFGYLGERLLNIYCIRHRLRVKHLPLSIVTLPDGSKLQHRQSAFTRWKYDIKYALSGRK